jgi:predicted metal-dependent hydrolase
MNHRRHANSLRYASDSLRHLQNNLNTRDYIKKVDTFFEYAKHDPDMVSFFEDAFYSLVAYMVVVRC